MTVHDYFTLCEKERPGKCTPLRRTSFALRRAGVDTMENPMSTKLKLFAIISKNHSYGIRLHDDLLSLCRENGCHFAFHVFTDVRDLKDSIGLDGATHIMLLTNSTSDIGGTLSASRCLCCPSTPEQGGLGAHFESALRR